MRNGDAVLSRYLAEWYTPHLRGRTITDIARRLQESLASMPAESSRPELLYAVEIPQDAYAFGLFAAESADLVTRACEQARLPADRITAAVEALLTEAIPD
jgi:hypothetical protein